MTSNMCPGCKSTLENAEDKFCSECGWRIGNSVFAQDGPTVIKLAIRRIRLFVKNRGNVPWMILAVSIALGGVAAIAMELWAAVLLALLLLYTLPLLFGWVTTELTGRHVTWAFYGYFALGSGAMFLIGPKISQEHTPVSLSQRSTKGFQYRRPHVASNSSNEDASRRAQATAQYWGTCVANLHVLRFGEPPDKESPAVLAEWSRKIKHAKSTSTIDVDSILVEMCRRNIARDESVLRLWNQSERWAKEEGRTTPKGSLKDNAETFLGWIDGMTDEEWDRLPENAKYVFEELAAYVEENLERLREIDRMQGRLSERYSSAGVEFPLPDLNEQTNTAPVPGATQE